MKKLFIIFFLTGFVYHLLSFAVFAVSPSPSPKLTPTETQENPIDEQISDLKERIASKVAQLRLVEKRGIVGSVSDTSDTQITLSDLQSSIRFIDVDELTKFSSPSAKEDFGISDIKKGAQVGVLGLYNKQSKRILARFVDVLTVPTFIHGAVASIDEKNGTLNVFSDGEKKYVVEVARVTKTLSYTKEDDLVRSGFSKIKVQDHVIIIGLADLRNKNLPAGRQGKIVATRVLQFPEIPKNPKINLPPAQEEVSEDLSPTPIGSKKVTPAIR